MMSKKIFIISAALALLLAACGAVDEPRHTAPPVSAPTSSATTEASSAAASEATTVALQYRLSVYDCVHGSVDPAGTYRFPAGREVTLTLTPDSGYELFRVEYGDQLFMANAASRSDALVQRPDGSWSVTFSVLDRDAGFFAYFEPIPQTLTLADSQTGISVSAAFRLQPDEETPALRIETLDLDDAHVLEFIPNLIDAVGEEELFALYSVSVAGYGSDGAALLSVPVGPELDGRRIKAVCALLSVPVADPYMYRIEETAPFTVGNGICEIEVPSILSDGLYALILLPEP